jgi:hypothetical protein
MSHRTILHGYIDEQLIAKSYSRHNDARIAALPSCARRHCPLITRDMFATPRHVSLGRIIPFGAAYNGVEGHWRRWRDEFEALLRTLYWWETQVWVATEQWGAYHCSWTCILPDGTDNMSESSATPAVELQPSALWRYHGPTRTVLH